MRKPLNIFIFMAALILPLTAQAHKFWMLPSSTVLSGDEAWVTVDAAISNDLFYFNHHLLRLDSLQVTAPDGSQVSAQNQHTGQLRSTFDVKITQQGTYKLALVNDGVFASYEQDGQRKRWRGDASALTGAVPADARNLHVSEAISRVEAFITKGAPSRSVLVPTGSGLELVPDTHPNDLYAGEQANFRMLLDGRPAKSLEVTIIPGDTRYRDDPETIVVQSDPKGRVSINWPRPGMYWLEASYEDKKTKIEQAETRRLTYVATLEVLPF